MAHDTTTWRAKPAIMTVALTAFLLAGCASSPYGGYDNATEADRKAVARGEWSETAAAHIAIDTSPYENGGITPKEAIPVILSLGIHCQTNLSPQLGGAVQASIWAVGVNGALMLAEGFGASSMVSIASRAAQTIDVQGGGAPVTVQDPLGGMADGVKTLIKFYPLQSVLPNSHLQLVLEAQAEAHTKGQCVVKHWDEYVSKHPEFFGTDVFVVEGGKNIFGSKPENVSK